MFHFSTNCSFVLPAEILRAIPVACLIKRWTVGSTWRGFKSWQDLVQQRSRENTKDSRLNIKKKTKRYTPAVESAHGTKHGSANHHCSSAILLPAPSSFFLGNCPSPASPLKTAKENKVGRLGYAESGPKQAKEKKKTIGIQPETFILPHMSGGLQ